MTDTPRHSVSVAAAIFDETEAHVLLIKRRDNGNWEPPGGVLELEEAIEDGLRREVLEETGAEISIGPLSGVYKNMERGIVALVFRASLQSRPLPSSTEAAEIRWISTREVLRLVEEAYAFRIFDALGQGAPAVRSHDGRHLLRTQGSTGRARE